MFAAHLGRGDRAEEIRQLFGPRRELPVQLADRERARRRRAGFAPARSSRPPSSRGSRRSGPTPPRAAIDRLRSTRSGADTTAPPRAGAGAAMLSSAVSVCCAFTASSTRSRAGGRASGVTARTAARPRTVRRHDRQTALVRSPPRGRPPGRPAGRRARRAPGDAPVTPPMRAGPDDGDGHAPLSITGPGERQRDGRSTYNREVRWSVGPIRHPVTRRVR